MSFDDQEQKQSRIGQAITRQRDSWSRQVNLIFKTRADANFKRRHRSPDRETTLMDLQTKFTPRDSETLNSFYETSMCQEQRKVLPQMYQKKLDEVSSIERHRFNMEEGVVDYRATLRNSNFVLQEYSANIRNKLWITKPKTSTYAKRQSLYI